MILIINLIINLCFKRNIYIYTQLIKIIIHHNEETNIIIYYEKTIEKNQST